MRKLLLLSLLALVYQSASAQLVTESFGSGANAFTMDFVTIGNPNNAPDTTGIPNPAGSVAYIYNLGKYEVSRDMIDKANAAGSLGITMYDMTVSYGGNGVNRPATGISWYEAATYVNWLNTSTGGTAAYKFVGGTFQLWSPTDAGYNANNKFRNSNAKFWLPSTDEWYKAAYGNPNGSWSNFPNGSDSVPTVGYTFGPPDITSAGELSAFGTMGQGGGVWEWNETAYDGTNDTAGENRVLRGGSWQDNGIYRDALYLRSENPLNGLGNLAGYVFGFRVAMIPEPSSLSLLVIGGVVVALGRRKK